MADQKGQRLSFNKDNYQDSGRCSTCVSLKLGMHSFLEYNKYLYLITD